MMQESITVQLQAPLGLAVADSVAHWRDGVSVVLPRIVFITRVANAHRPHEIVLGADGSAFLLAGYLARMKDVFEVSSKAGSRLPFLLGE